jgi:heme exporter protein D
MSDYFAMGGYAAFVWPAYGLSAIVMIGLVALVWRGLRANEKTLSLLQAARQAANEDPQS